MVSVARPGETSPPPPPGLRKPAGLVHLLCVNLRGITKLLWGLVALGVVQDLCCRVNGLPVCPQFLDFSKAATNDVALEVKK